ncbi:unnamed protein product [Paramecium pentaurelia]|uniref:Uncharacterized protein n=1 Tax=Paramecium pentaurelia TaxID=43138 RepID=A0A8S1TFT9_9CILI|nr:unnamed protein product [Paramecium pentaurelia]CAD8150768.1 unnamed protein product [Paramecium pentaurelia]
MVKVCQYVMMVQQMESQQRWYFLSYSGKRFYLYKRIFGQQFQWRRMNDFCNWKPIFGKMEKCIYGLIQRKKKFVRNSYINSLTEKNIQVIFFKWPF